MLGGSASSASAQDQAFERLNAEGVQLPDVANWKPEGQVPRTADGKPDLTGVWWQGHDFDFNPAPRPAAPRPPAAAPAAPRVTYQSLYNDAAKAKLKTLSAKDDPSLQCIPEIDGPQTSDIFQILQTPKFIAYLQETFHGFRLIPLDGRPHSEIAPPQFRGDSVGHWEGDTLVVDVTNFSPRNWVFYGVNGLPSIHSDALRVTERFTRIAGNALQVERTYDDPKVLTRPFMKPKKIFTLAPYDQVMEVICTMNATGALMESAAKLEPAR